MLTSVVRFWVIVVVSNIFSRTIIQNTPPRRPHNCFKTIIYNFYYGQHSLQTLIILNTYENMLNDNFPSIKSHPKEYMDCGIDWLMSGMEWHQKYVKTSYKVCPGGYRQLSGQVGVIQCTRQQNDTYSQNCPNELQFCFAHYFMNFNWNHMTVGILARQDNVVYQK